VRGKKIALRAARRLMTTFISFDATANSIDTLARYLNLINYLEMKKDRGFGRRMWEEDVGGNGIHRVERAESFT
jgi:hypothetical protein